MQLQLNLSLNVIFWLSSHAGGLGDAATVKKSGGDNLLNFKQT